MLFASGMAAVAAVLLHAAEPGDAVVIARRLLPRRRELAHDAARPRGVEVRAAPRPARRGGARARPGLDGDARRTRRSTSATSPRSRRATRRHARSWTTRTADATRPAAARAGRRLVGGERDQAASAATATSCSATSPRATRSASRPCAPGARDAGAIPGPFEAWLAHRSLADARRCGSSAGARTRWRIAEAARGARDVAGVRYPGLPGDPGPRDGARARCAARDRRLVRPRQPRAAERFLAAARAGRRGDELRRRAHSSAERRARWGGDAVPEGFIRFSAGCEDAGGPAGRRERALDALGVTLGSARMDDWVWWMIAAGGARGGGDGSRSASSSARSRSRRVLSARRRRSPGRGSRSS